MTKKTTQTADQQQESKKLPTHIAKVRHGFGRNARYERIGVAWTNEDGSFYVKLYGTQVVSNFTLYANPPTEDVDEDAGTDEAEAGE